MPDLIYGSVVSQNCQFMFISVDQFVDQTNESAVRLNSSKGREEPSTRERILAPEEAGIPPHVIKGVILGSAENEDKRIKMLESIHQEPVEFAFERTIGENDSVYSNFCDLITFAKQKVGRIVIKSGIETTGCATGFMVSDRLLLTNWHVFKTPESVQDSEVQFNYEYDRFGREKPSIIFKLNPNDFFHSHKELDYCFVAVQPKDITGKTDLSSIGYIYLDPGLGKIGEEGKELLNIIHHPGGDFKQLSIRENMFTKITTTTIWYASDTAQGSSGSPVFNDQWQIVGLHHMGVPRRNDQGDFIDKKGNVIEVMNGKIDVSKIQWIANEGIRISVLLKDIFDKFPDSPFVNGLKIAFRDGGESTLIDSGLITNRPIEKDSSLENNETSMDSNTSNQVQVSFPVSLLEKNNQVNIHISNGMPIALAAPAVLAKTESGGIEEDFTEGAKMDRENAMDFSDARGYSPKFLGTEVPLPRPKRAIRKFIAKLKGSESIVLPYYHYSVIFHSVRMQPLISAINVDGDLKKRQDTTKRKDDWLRDNRLDFDVQLNDKYYSNSGFQKGHLSRREDANWGSTPEDAKRFADITCMYTNACPQVGMLNQSSQGGLWGRLEQVLLEEGASQERGRTAKISVFNGPIFADNDPVYKGIQVPLEFWKIIAWINDAKELKATAFRLSQADFVNKIEFDEAIDIDTNLEFLEYQCSIKSLEQITQIDFSALAKFDTFDPSAGEEEGLRIDSEQHLRETIRKNQPRK